MYTDCFLLYSAASSIFQYPILFILSMLIVKVAFQRPGIRIKCSYREPRAWHQAWRLIDVCCASFTLSSCDFHRLTSHTSLHVSNNLLISLETSLATMDYSSIHENENLTGPSPWATSPQAGRNSFGDSRPPPDSPTPGARGHSAQNSADLSVHDATLPPPATAVESDHPDPAQPPSDEPSSIPYRPQQQEHQEQPQPPIQNQAQQRYHNRPTSRQHAQYKLQPKVTGLERPGRKDPILRFDVYVCSPAPRPHECS